MILLDTKIPFRAEDITHENQIILEPNFPNDSHCPSVAEFSPSAQLEDLLKSSRYFDFCRQSMLSFCGTQTTSLACLYSFMLRIQARHRRNTDSSPQTKTLEPTNRRNNKAVNESFLRTLYHSSV